VAGAFKSPKTYYYKFEIALRLLKQTEKTKDAAFEEIKCLTSAKSSGMYSHIIMYIFLFSMLS
jgi:hypothetical protein